MKYRSLNKRELPYGDSGIDRRKHIVRLSLTRHISIPTLPPPPPEKRFKKKNMPPPAFVFVQIKIKIKNLPPASVSSKSSLRNKTELSKVNRIPHCENPEQLPSKESIEPDADAVNESFANALDYCPWCKEKVGDPQGGICCESCLQWLHFSCEGIVEADYENVESDQPYECRSCQLERASNISDSLIEEGMRDDETLPKQVLMDDLRAGGDCEYSNQDDVILIEDPKQMLNGPQTGDEGGRSANGMPRLTAEAQDIEIKQDSPGLQPVTCVKDGTPARLPNKENHTTLPAQKKVSKPRRKKPEVPSNSDDQLKLAQSYIVTLERKINDLEDSNSLLKQELKYSERTTEYPARNDRKSDSPPVGGPVLTNHITTSHCDPSDMRERLNTIEMELMRSRLTSLEMMVSRMGPAMPPPTPGLHYSHPGIPMHGLLHHIPQTPVAYHPYAQMTAPLPFISMPQPCVAPGNMFYPVQLPFKQVPVISHAPPPRQDTAYAGFRLVRNVNPQQHQSRPSVPVGNIQNSPMERAPHPGNGTSRRPEVKRSCVQSQDAKSSKDVSDLYASSSQRPVSVGTHDNVPNENKEPCNLSSVSSHEAQTSIPPMPSFQRETLTQEVAMESHGDHDRQEDATEKSCAEDKTSQPDSFLCMGRASHLTWRERRLSH